MSDEQTTEETKEQKAQDETAVSDKTSTVETKPVDDADAKAWKAERAQLIEKLTRLETAEDARKKKKLEEEGKYEELLAKERGEKETLLTKIKQIERRDQIREAVESAELDYSVKAVRDNAIAIDGETGGELEPKELIKRAQERLKGWGLAPDGGTAGIGSHGGGSATTRKKTDKRMEQLIKAYKNRDTAAYLRLRGELERDGEKVPRIADLAG